MKVKKGFLLIIPLAALLFSFCRLPAFDLTLAEELAGAGDTPYTYTVTFNSQWADIPADPPVKTVVSPAVTIDALPSDPVRHGYSFGGWWTQPGGGGSSFSASTPVTGNLTVYAKWTALALFSLSYNPNGADGGSVPSGSVSYSAGTSVTVLGNTGGLYRTGYSFAGWNTEPDGSGSTHAAGTLLAMPAEDLMLYARWTTEPVYTVTYNGNGAVSGSLPSDPNNYIADDTVTVLPKPSDLRGPTIQDGITQRFINWNTSSDGSGASYEAGESFSMPTANSTLYAIWTNSPDPLTKIGPAGGYVFIDNGTIINGWRYMEIAPAAAEVSGVQWGADGNLLGAADTAPGVGRYNTNLISIAIEGAETGRAAQIAGELSFNGYSDWFLPSLDELIAAYAEIKAPGIAVFSDSLYWSSTEQGAANAESIDFISGTQFGVSKNSSLYVRPVRAFRTEQETHSVFFRKNGATSGTVPQNLYFYQIGDVFTAPDNTGFLARTGHSFNGWNTEPDGSGTDYIPGNNYSMPAGDLVLYARWTPDTFLILFQPNDAVGGTPPSVMGPFLAGELVTVPENTGGLYRTNYTFAGWNSDPGGSGDHYEPSTNFAMPASNLILNTQWGPPFNIGSGTEADPYRVSNPEHLNNVREYPDAYFVQTVDIILNISPWDEGDGWLPIGTSAVPFSGDYDGVGYSIIGLTISGNQDYVGLFGYMTSGRIANLNLENASVFNNGNSTGILLGHQVSTLGNPGTINKCSVAGTLVSTGNDTGGLAGYFFLGNINESYSFADVSGAERTGGLVGLLDRIDMTNRGQINRCVSKGTVTGTGSSHVGGGVGVNEGYIYDSYSTGAVNGGAADYVGGFIGQNWYCVYTSYASGPVTGTGANIGGFAGAHSGAQMVNCYYDSDTTGQAGPASALTTAEMTKEASFTGLDFTTIWTIQENVSYPYLQFQGGGYVPYP